MAGEGQQVGNFVIERELASGGMGVVYVARHAVTEARVALKLMRPEAAKGPGAAERFLREVKAAARIGHDGIVRVLDAGQTADGELFLAMELLQGQTLDDRMQAGDSDRWTLVQWLLQALDPLTAAHAAGIVHRDLKPENIFLSRGSDGRVVPKLLDFGIARDAESKSVTATGLALGTPHYMSPEQASAPSTAGPPSDVWSVGVMLYEALSGQMPFDGETVHAVLIQLATRPHRPLSALVQGLDPALVAVVERCLHKDPAARFTDAGQLRTALRAALELPGVKATLQLGLTSDAPAADSDAHADTLASLPPSFEARDTADVPSLVMVDAESTSPSLEVDVEGTPASEASTGAQPGPEGAAGPRDAVPRSAGGRWAVAGLLLAVGVVVWGLADATGELPASPAPAATAATPAPQPSAAGTEERRVRVVLPDDVPAPGELADGGTGPAVGASADPRPEADALGPDDGDPSGPRDGDPGGAATAADADEGDDAARERRRARRRAAREAEARRQAQAEAEQAEARQAEAQAEARQAEAQAAAQEAAARAEAEAARQRAEAERRARLQAEQLRKQREAEAARKRAEAEAARKPEQQAPAPQPKPAAPITF